MILAMDSSAECGSAALVGAQGVVREITFAGGRSRKGGVTAALTELAAGGIRGVVVGLGPGSYNGIRSAVAAAWGFALARGIPLTGVSSLLAIATGEYLAAGDARQSQFYFAHVRNGAFVTEPALHGREGLLELIGAHPDLPVYAPAPLGVPREVVATPRAALLAGFAEPSPGPLRLPTPIYLKPPHITQPRKRHA